MVVYQKYPPETHICFCAHRRLHCVVLLVVGVVRHSYHHNIGEEADKIAQRMLR
jgi:hypothetical protein